MSDNRVIRTSALDILGYASPDDRFAVQKGDTTYQASWQTIMSTLTAAAYDEILSIPTTPPPTTPPPTTPGPTTPPPTTPPPTTPPPTTPAIYYTETADQSVISSSGGVVTISVAWQESGVFSSVISFQVSFNGGSFVQWAYGEADPALSSGIAGIGFNSNNPAWHGAGSYVFKVVFTTSGGTRTSNNVTVLIV